MRGRVLLGVALAVLASACSAGSSGPGDARRTTNPSTRATGTHPASFSDAVQVGGGSDHHSQRFCATPPGRGFVQYEVAQGTARLRVRVQGLASDGLFGLVWGPGGGHSGEVIASVRVSGGATVQPTLRFFHAPFYDRPGTEILLSDAPSKVVATLRPC